MYLFIKLSCQY